MGWSLFGSSDTQTTQSTSNTASQDQRVLNEGSVGTIVSPGAAVSDVGGGSVTAQPGATVTQTISSEGIQSDDVKSILDSVLAQSNVSQEAITGLGQSLADSVTNQTSKLADIVQATKTPETTTITKLLPFGVLAVIVFFIMQKGK